MPGSDTRAADTQKCIRAGGKHNDLEDVGIDTYHHTFFEMLGNWSFGDYFKKEAIEWAWELVVGRWGFPPARLYATIYQPDASQGDPAARDEEAWGFWAEKFRAAGLDPAVHIVNGNKKDNFWMMGETGPCGPCSELHVDLTPAGDTKGRLVNQGTAECIEIWNLVFIQFNANPDGTFSPLPAQHVDTGMGFERVASIIQGTKGFTDFANAKISNYETDVFRPIFDELEKMSGKRYTSTLPQPNAQGAIVPANEQEAVDIAFRVIADHIRTLSFAVADGIQPGNNDRNYVLRRILRRAVKYGRNLGFKEPFFYKLVDVLAQHMGGVFPELRTKLQFVKETLRREEEAFNRTLDKGIELFTEAASRLMGSTGVPPVAPGVPPGASTQRSASKPNASQAPAAGAKYGRRNLPHFERPWAIYHIVWSTVPPRRLSPDARTVVLNAARHFHDKRYELFAACVMPDHVHLLLQPWVKEENAEGNPVFWPLSELVHSLKSFTAHAINKAEGEKGVLWTQERFDRYVRSDRDLEEKFQYICDNPWRDGVASEGEEYPWVWALETAEKSSSLSLQESTSVSDVHGGVPGGTPETTGGTPVLPGDFAFKLYDTYGFPLDLTELMARERGLTVDTAGFEQHMQEQRARARAAQKKTVIELSEIETKEPTHFLGYDHDHTGADVAEVLNVKGKTAVILNNSVLYAEMGGQVGDTGELAGAGRLWRVANTQKSGNTFLHFLEESEDAPAVGDHVTVRVDRARREAIQRHHTVTHLLHWALHEVVSREATQKGSLVNPDKLTFDFNSGALTAEQLRDVERLVNERVLENAPVSWTEVPYASVRGRGDIMQAFGDKYGDQVRVVQIGGEPGSLAGYSMELCGGTHTRHTGEVGLVSHRERGGGRGRSAPHRGDRGADGARARGGRQRAAEAARGRARLAAPGAGEEARGRAGAAEGARAPARIAAQKTGRRHGGAARPQGADDRWHFHDHRETRRRLGRRFAAHRRCAQGVGFSRRRLSGGHGGRSGGAAGERLAGAHDEVPGGQAHPDHRAHRRRQRRRAAGFRAWSREGRGEGRRGAGEGEGADRGRVASGPRAIGSRADSRWVPL